MNVRVDIPSIKPLIGEKLVKWLATPRALLIDGKWTPAQSGKTFAVHDPATGEKIADVA